MTRSPGILLLAVQDAQMACLFQAYLEQDGYQVHPARGDSEALEAAVRVRPDLVLLDQRLLPGDREGTLRRLLTLARTGLILLTHQDPIEDERQGSGASEVIVITRSLRPRDLSARVRKTLQLAGEPVPQACVYRDGEFTLDRDRHTLQVTNRFIDLTLTEFDLLSLLMSLPGKVFSRVELRAWVGGLSHGGTERTIDVHIRNLRLKLGREANPERAIQTVHGAGYRFVPQPTSGKPGGEVLEGRDKPTVMSRPEGSSEKGVVDFYCR